MSDIETTGREKVRRRLHRGVGGLGIFLLIALPATFVISIIHDLFRTVLAPSSEPGTAAEAPVTGNRREVNSATDDAPTSNTETMVIGGKRFVIRAMREEAFADAGKKAEAAQINADYAAFLKKLEAYMADTRTDNFVESLNALGGLMTEYLMIHDRLLGLTHLENGSPEWKDRYGDFEAMNTFFDDAFLHCYARHGEWFSYVRTRRPNGISWDEEVFYLRKMGAKGDALIALRSSQRLYQSLRDSLFSVGPDFHLPTMEPEY